MHGFLDDERHGKMAHNKWQNRNSQMSAALAPEKYLVALMLGSSQSFVDWLRWSSWNGGKSSEEWWSQAFRQD